MSAHLFEQDIEFFDMEPDSLAGTKAPDLSLWDKIPKTGSPNRLLETYEPLEALKLVTHEHRLIADWVKAQGWSNDLNRARWPYVHATIRFKKCRQELRAFVRSLGFDDSEWAE